MSDELESRIVTSWEKNAKPWISAVRNNEIESRVLATNRAIVDTILTQSPNSVLDIGCGEGWLVRKLNEFGIDVLGIDAIKELVESARSAHKGRYRTLSYEQLSYQTLGEQFDLLVCNFSLFGEKSVEGIFRSAGELLHPKGSLVIQTLHPLSTQEELHEGWIKSSWAGLSNKFNDPAPWYCRSIENWVGLYTTSGFSTPETIEPVNPKTAEPASLILVGSCNTNCLPREAE